MADWERLLERWTKAGLIETSAADLIRNFEAYQAKAGGLKWPVMLAIALGGLLLAAGILLFIAAHWDALSPSWRFRLVLAMIAVIHIGGALASSRFGILSTVLHAVGTICLGAGIFLAGQIFNLQEHWPGGVMLWALGSWAAWALLRDWPQAALVAVLTPAWLLGEWSVATRFWNESFLIMAAGSLMLTIAYLTAMNPGKDSHVREALLWIGGLALIPSASMVAFSGITYTPKHTMPWTYYSLGWASAFFLPLALSFLLRGRKAWLNLIAALWVAALSATQILFKGDETAGNLVSYFLCALGSIGLIAWGLKERRKVYVNLGIAGFALTVVFFYFSSVMDKLGRSASLIGLGLLFLLGGWLLEKIRRRLINIIGRGAV